MNSAPVEGAERIRAGADPNRGPRPELFEGRPGARGFRPFGTLGMPTPEGHMKAIAAVAATLLATPALADPGHFAESHGHNHWFAAGTLALAGVIGAVALWRARRDKPARKAEKKA